MKIYLIQQLIDNCAWITLEAYKDKTMAEQKLKHFIKKYLKEGTNLCIHDYKIEEMNLR